MNNPESHKTSGLPSAEQIKAYHAGKLSPAQAHDVERALADSPWQQDAEEGWKLDPQLEGMKKIKLPGKSFKWQLNIGLTLLVTSGLAFVLWPSNDNLDSQARQHTENNLHPTETPTIDHARPIEPN